MGGINQNKANLAQFQMKLLAGAKLGNRNSKCVHLIFTQQKNTAMWGSDCGGV